MQNVAIRVQNLTKMYKLYDKPTDRLVESLGLSKKKCYKEHYALNGINMVVNQGETVGIIGTNGSGKSTILKIITGVLTPTSGNVEINGRISALLELGAGFNMEYTGLENVYLNGTMIGFSREEIDEKIDAILEFADIGEFIHQPVKTYSSGMFVRLAFAVAINIEPEILIVDEALSVGDVFFQAKCYRKFEEFKKMGKTILFVSHDLASVNKYCDRVILLNKGIKVDEGSPKVIIDIYKKILVNQYDENENKGINESNGKINENNTLKHKSDDSTEIKLYKEMMQQNPNVIKYGSGIAEIIDFAVLDQNGQPTNTIESGADNTVLMKVKFNRKINNPIFAYTIKDVLGVELVGTNTMYEQVNTGTVNPGDIREVKFRQKWNLQNGDFLLSLGCTGYENGEFVVYSRLYDVCCLSVFTDRNFVGKWNANSEVSYS